MGFAVSKKRGVKADPSEATAQPVAHPKTNARSTKSDTFATGRTGNGAAFFAAKNATVEGIGRKTSVQKSSSAIDARYKAVVEARTALLERLAGVESNAATELRSALESQLPTEPGPPSRLSAYERTTSRLNAAVRELTSLGAAGPLIRPTRTSTKKIPKAQLRLLEEFKTHQPSLKRQIDRLMTARPELFTDVDPSIKKTFAKALLEFVDGGYAKGEVAGLGTFLDRLAERRFDGRVPGFSHTHGLNMGIVMNHPGLILALIRAAKDDVPYQTHGVYDGDGPRTLEPLRQFKRPFSRSAYASLGYEYGLLLATVYHLAPDGAEAHPDLLRGRSPVAAIGAEKLTGQTIRYRYAFNLRTGEDLVRALETQGPYGLAMGDVNFRSRLGFHRTHFGFFSDYDPESRTVRLDDFWDDPMIVPIDNLRFTRNVSMYIRPHDDLTALLTPERETKLGDLYPQLRTIHDAPLEQS